MEATDGDPRRVVVGAGGFGRELRDLLRDAGLRVHGFLDDAPSDAVLARGPALDAPLLGPTDALVDLEVPFLLGLGWPRARAAALTRLTASGRAPAPAAVHPSAVLGRHVALGPGTVVAALAVVMTDVRLGPNVLVNYGCTVGHDTIVAENAVVMPGASLSGQVVVGAGATIGGRAFVREGCTVGDGATVGAGAVVVADVPPGATAVGVPARVRPGG